MGLLTAKLPDGEHEALRRLASERGVSMAELIRQWIKAAPGIAPRDKSHAACDQRIAELEARLRRQVSTPAVDTSTVPGLEVHGIAEQGGTAGMEQADPIHRPAFLAAPDDDCAACGHDRHRWVQEGVCKAPTFYESAGRRRETPCGCTDFATREELTF